MAAVIVILNVCHINRKLTLPKSDLDLAADLLLSWSNLAGGLSKLIASPADHH